MSSVGRPRLDQKDGYHRHDGYDRLHPVEQHHWGNLHKSTDDATAVELVALLEGIERLEKQDIGSEMLLELEKSIETLLRIKRAKANHNGRGNDQREEQSALGDTEGEVREPNTIGVP